MNSDFVNELISSSALLTLLDKIYQNEHPLHRPVATDGEDSVASWDLATAFEIEARFLRNALSDKLPSSLKRFNLSLSVAGSVLALVDTSTGEKLSRRGVRELIHKIEDAFQKLGETREVREQLAKWFEALAQQSLECCVEEILQRCSDLNEEHLRQFQMRPVGEWNAEEIGLTVKEAGLLPAYCGFSALVNENIVSMPNFVEWTENSEYVLHKLKDVPESNRSIGRMWRLMMYFCFRAPCHEIIHLIQYSAGQRMTTQLAEHDGYFACNILSLLNASNPKLSAFYFGGLWEETIMMQLSHSSQILQNPPLGWNRESYIHWRDTFGVGNLGKTLWNDKDFGATSDEYEGHNVEFVVGPFLCTEATAPQGRFIDHSSLEIVVPDMLASMFHDRTNRHSDAKYNEASKRHEIMCTNRPVNIRDSVKLSHLSPEERMKLLKTPIDSQALNELTLFLNAVQL